MLDPRKVQLIHQLIDNIEENVAQVKRLAAELVQESGDDADWNALDVNNERLRSDGEIMEGVFTGMSMIGSDGREYPVPENYASKSKLVEGDILKLTIRPDGSYLYKQIKPIDRDRIKGVLVKDRETQEFRVLVEDRLYRILCASVSYFKGQPGDEAIIVIPMGGSSKWAAVENIISRSYSEDFVDESMDSPDLNIIDDLNISL